MRVNERRHWVDTVCHHTAQGYFVNTTDKKLIIFRSKLGHEPFHFSFVQQTFFQEFVI